jgi:hypothetical protein
MFKSLLVGAAVSIVAVTAFAGWQDFQSGYYAGWAAGYRHIHGEFSIPPIAPIPPIPPVGQDSFGEGFIYGEEAVQGQ